MGGWRFLGFWFGNFVGADLLFRQSCAGEPGSSRCKADGFRRLFLRSAQKVQLWLDILEGLCPIEVGQFLLVQADKMPY